MRNLLMIAAAIAGAGVFMAQMADQMSPTPALAKGSDKATASSSAADQFFPRTTVSPTGGTRVSLPRDFRGHFQAIGRIDGQHINFMVDTGASVVALNEKSAAKFGLRPLRSDYNATVTTANGTIKAARTRIAGVGRRWSRGARCRSHGAARRGAVRKPARPVVPVEAEAFRIRRWPARAGAVRFTAYQSAFINRYKSPFPPIVRPGYSLWLRGSLKHFR